MEEPISVLIPLYNSEKYIACTLSSVVNQTWKELEIIIVDDGSTDSSAKIVESFQEEDSRIKLYSQKNMGIGYTRNRLLSLSSSSLILFVDSDDILPPNFISLLYEAKARNKAEIASARVVHFRNKPRKKKGGKEEVYSGEEFLVEMTRPMGKFCYSHSRLMDKALFLSLSFPEDKIFEDVVLMPKIVIRARCVVFVPEAQYNYRINRNGLSHSPFSLRSLDEMDGYMENIKLGEKIENRQVVYYSSLFFLTKYYYYFFKVLFKRMGVKEYLRRYSGEKRRILALRRSK
mgnify:FL=1